MRRLADAPGYQDHVEWVEMITQELMEIFKSIFGRKPTISEIEGLLGVSF